MKKNILRILLSMTLCCLGITTYAQQDKNSNYLSFTAIGNSTISISSSEETDVNLPQLVFRKNGGEWEKFLVDTWINLNDGDKIEFKAETENAYFSKSPNEYLYFSSYGDGKLKVSGDIMTLLSAKEELTEIPCDYCFTNLFKYCNNIISTPTLPATTLTTGCYSNMFSGCTEIKDMPKLPAKDIAEGCYSGMFSGCTSLYNLSPLPATILKESCYSSMFSGCTAIRSIPQNLLPATTLANNCYSYMFSGCSALYELPNLPARILNEACYSGMFSYCTSLKHIPTSYLPASSIAERCYASMFSNCTSLESVPQKLLPAKKLYENCYAGMFSNCSSLTSLPQNFLPATTLNTGCYTAMFQGCTSLTTVPQDLLPATELANNCYNVMFVGCTNLQNAPDLPATELKQGCYSSMFCNCQYITDINVGFSDWLNGAATSSWLYGVSTTGTFHAPNNIDEQRGTSYIPNNWTLNSNTDNDIVDYLCITAVTNSDIKLTKYGNSWDAPKIQYRIGENGKWTDVDYSNSNPIYLKAGQKIYYRAKDENETFSQSSSNTVRFSINGEVKASGNVMSLLSAKREITSISNPYCFAFLFADCEGLLTPPELPATELAEGCYWAMFWNCSSLQSAPKLPATELTKECYARMFENCTSLTTGPDLLSKELKEMCYRQMFKGCSNLSSLKVGFTNWNGEATREWMTGVQTYGHFKMTPEAKNSLEIQKGASKIPASWTPYKVTFVPTGENVTTKEIKPLISDDYGKVQLFGASYQRLGFTQTGWSTKINGQIEYGLQDEIYTYKDLTLYPVWEVEYFCLGRFYANWTVVFNKRGENWNAPELLYKIDNGQWQPLEYNKKIKFKGTNMYVKTARDGINDFSISETQYISICTGSLQPSGNIMTLVDATGEATEIPNDYCFYRLFASECTACFSSAENLDLPATTLKPHCYEELFDWMICMESAPYLPATNLVDYCYQRMFNGCFSLQSISVGFTEWHENATNHWVWDAAYNSNGINIFNAPEELEIQKGISFIPENWGPYVLSFKDGDSELPQIISKTGVFFLNGETFTREGDIQIGWATEIGGPVKYQLTTKIESKSDLTLYPVWKYGIDIEGSPSMCNDYQNNTYTVNNALNGRTYKWSLSNNTAAQITSTDNTSVTIQSKPNTEKEVTLTVTEYEGDNITAKASLNIQINQRPTGIVNTIYGPSEIMMCSEETKIFSVPSTGEFYWEVPQDATIISGQGTNTIQVKFGTNAGNIFVYKQNGDGCRAYESQSKYINLNAANCDKNMKYAENIHPVSLTGEFSVCVNHTSTEYRNYEVMNRNTNCTYNWVLSKNTTASIAPYSNSINGNITIIWEPEDEDVVLTVQEINKQGYVIGESEYIVNVRIRPYHANTQIHGNIVVSSNATETYTVTSDIPGNEFYWFQPYGTSIISGQGTNSITVQFGPNTSGNMVVYQENGGEWCRSYEQESQWVQINNNPNTYLKSYNIDEDFDAYELQDTVTHLQIVLFPLPVEHILNVKSNAYVDCINIYNSMGKLILQETNTTSIDVSDITAGTYLVEVKTEIGTDRKSIVITK